MCGAPLGNMINAAPVPNNPNPPIVERPIAQEPYKPPTPTPAVYIPPPIARPTLRLIHTSGREFRLLGEEGNIGRQTQTSKNLPEIDLTGIPNEGVISRSHARIYWDHSQNTYNLVDNNSRNGTYLNGNLLAASAPYRLNHNDSLQLGQDYLVCFTVAMM